MEVSKDEMEWGFDIIDSPYMPCSYDNSAGSMGSE
jgi:hypothetical protein